MLGPRAIADLAVHPWSHQRHPRFPDRFQSGGALLGGVQIRMDPFDNAQFLHSHSADFRIGGIRARYLNYATELNLDGSQLR